MRPTVVNVNPVLFNAPSGQRYAVAGSVWVPIPSDVTRDTLSRFVKWEPPEAKAESSSMGATREWSVVGSKGNSYCVIERGGAWGCSCVGYGYRRKCRHIDEIKKEQAAEVE